MTGGRDRVVVVSHACVLAANRDVYAHLASRRDVELVVPSRWRDAHRPEGYDAETSTSLQAHVHPVRVAVVGRPQRHVYLARCGALLTGLGARALFVEEEPFSLAALQWSRAARRHGVPYGVQVAETKDRTFPRPVVRARGAVLRHATFVAARSPAAAALAARWGARGEVAVVPHGVEPVDAVASPPGPFTVAYVGRLVEEKGLRDLLDAVARLDGAVELVVAGGGPLAPLVASAGPHVRLLGSLAPAQVADVYARAHVTCVPSRTTPTWEEQFGRVVVESLVRGVPVVATSTGELPWVLSVTGGGVLVAERDPGALAEALGALAADRAAAASLGAAGRAGTLRAFTNEAAAHALDDVLGRLSASRAR